MTITNDQWKEIYDVAYREVRKAVTNATDAEDLAQDTLERLWQRDEANLIANVFVAYELARSVGKHRAIDHNLKEQRRREIEAQYGDNINARLTGQSSEALAADPFDMMTRDEMLKRLDDLSPVLRRTVEAHYLDGMTVQKIAKGRGVTEDVIYKRLQRARDIVTGDTNDD